MCGLAGLITTAADVPDVGLLARAGAELRYRGPDDEGSFRAPHVGLVHRRLSIRDLSAAGRCPLASPDGRIQVMLNGEIYNWRELRAELAALGFMFRTSTDTEVIVHGYARWGQGVVDRLRGMFAVAVWSVDEQRLLLARDRVGEKPLFFRHDPGRFAFASSTGALAILGRGRDVDPEAIACYLSHSFIPATHTVWQGAHVLPPGHLLAVSPGGSPEVRQYWSLPDRAPVRISPGRALAETEAIIEDSVVRCLDADVPVGVFLSGGVDSSLVAAMAAKHSPGIATFSVGFAEEEFSEVVHAHRVAEHIGVPHHAVEVGVEDVIASLPHLVTQYGQPFGDASAVPSFLVSCLARNHVTVCLSGDGGDESFGGYWRLQAGVYADRYRRLVPAVIRRSVVPPLAARLGSPGRRWLAMNELSLAAGGPAYSNFESWFRHLEAIAGPQLEAGLTHDLVGCRTRPGRHLEQATLTQRLLYDDFRVQLPDDYLTKVDVASMAASLEVRAPFLDQRVVEHAWTLPDELKLRWGERKWLLKRIAARWVPASVVYRPKMGFALPLVHWWRGRLGEYLEQLLADSQAEAEGWIRVAPVREALARHRRGENHHTRLWLVLWLELWFRLVFRPATP
jgi:asparagine synthase (glutamine-hydrolysing)